MKGKQHILDYFVIGKPYKVCIDTVLINNATGRVIDVPKHSVVVVISHKQTTSPNAIVWFLYDKKVCYEGFVVAYESYARVFKPFEE